MRRDLHLQLRPERGLKGPGLGVEKDEVREAADMVNGVQALDWMGILTYPGDTPCRPKLENGILSRRGWWRAVRGLLRMGGIGGCALGVACSNFPAIEGGQCGNAVIDATEDCDTFPVLGHACRAPGAPGACRLDCSQQSDGTRNSCPAGLGCNPNGVCQRATGEYELTSSFEAGAVASLSSGDFDGDGRAEVLSREPPDSLLRSVFRLHYFDENARLVETQAFPKLAAAPQLRDLDRDGSDDLLFSDLRIGLVRGRADRRFVPETFSTYRLPQSQLHGVGVHSMVVQGTAAYVTLARIDGINGLYVADAFTGKLGLRATLGGEIEELAGRPVSGDLIEGEGSPCLEIVAAFRGAESFSMFEVCRPRSPTDPAIADFPESMPFWLDQARETVVHLPPGVTLDNEAPVVADIDCDGHLDALVGAAGRAYLARGDGSSLATLAAAYSLPFAGNAQVSPAIPMPLAAGDFSNDGFVDFVFKDRLVTSSRVPGSAVPGYTITQGTKGEPWTTALVADFNGNGMLDIVAASSASAGVQFFNGTGGLFQIASTLPTDRPVLDLARGDFDGDRIADVAFIEAAARQSDRDSLHIAFGNSATPPSLPVQVGQLANANALASYGDAGLDSLLVSSSARERSRYQGALTLLGGSSDRLPFAPCALVSFSLDGSIVNALAIDFGIGKFTRDGTNDVLALASDDFATHWSFWLVPAIDRGDPTPTPLAGELPLGAFPVQGPASHRLLQTSSAAADLTGDGVDESIWLLPTLLGDSCVVGVMGVDDSKKRLTSASFLLVGQPCGDAQLVAKDVDRDGAIDLVILTDRGSPQQLLEVLWNDGTGHFSAAAGTPLSAPAAAPFKSFALLDGERPELLFTTSNGLYSARTDETGRGFEASVQLQSLDAGEAVTVADVNGDGVADLVVADARGLTVLRAALAP